jgi:hypothetical protein
MRVARARCATHGDYEVAGASRDAPTIVSTATPKPALASTIAPLAAGACPTAPVSTPIVPITATHARWASAALVIVPARRAPTSAVKTSVRTRARFAGQRAACHGNAPSVKSAGVASARTSATLPARNAATALASTPASEGFAVAASVSTARSVNGSIPSAVSASPSAPRASNVAAASALKSAQNVRSVATVHVSIIAPRAIHAAARPVLPARHVRNAIRPAGYASRPVLRGRFAAVVPVSPSVDHVSNAMNPPDSAQTIAAKRNAKRVM